MFIEYIYLIIVILLCGAATLQAMSTAQLIRAFAAKQGKAVEQSQAAILNIFRQEVEIQKVAIENVKAFQKAHYNLAQTLNENVQKIQNQSSKINQQTAQVTDQIKSMDTRLLKFCELATKREQAVRAPAVSRTSTVSPPPATSPQKTTIMGGNHTVSSHKSLSPTFKDLLSKIPGDDHLAQAQKVLEGKISHTLFAKKICSALTDQSRSNMDKILNGLSSLTGKKVIAPRTLERFNKYKDNFACIRIDKNSPELTETIRAAAEKVRKGKPLVNYQVLFIICPAFVSSTGEVSNKGLLVTT